MGLDRRSFIKAFTAFGAGATAGILFTPAVWKLLDDVSIWSQNWSWIPRLEYGETTYANAVSKTCPSAAAVKVRLVKGRPVRVLPNEEHPLGGGVTALAAAELQLLYSGARVQKPLLRQEDGSFKEIEWSAAAELLHGKLKESRSDTAFVSGDENGSVTEVISAFASGLGSDKVFLMPSEAQNAAKACDLMGIDAQLGYDIENADYVLAIGANILETWGTVVRNRKAFADSRPHPEEGVSQSAAFAYAGPVQNNTASVAQPWLPIKPGTETILALGIANLLIAKGRATAANDFGVFAQLSAKFPPEDVAKLTGVSVEGLAKVVDGLLAAKRPLVIVGGEFNQGAGAAPVLAGFALNALLGNINAKGGVKLLPEAGTVLEYASRRRDLYKNDLVNWIGADKKPSVLVFNEANPVYALPNPAATAAFIKDVPFKAAFASFLDETARECDLVLPTPMGMERIDDVISPYGCGKSIYCVTLPVTQPNADTRAAANTLLFIAKQMGMDFGVGMYEELLKEKAYRMRANFDILAAGMPAENDDTVTLYSFNLRADVIAKETQPEDNGLALAVFSKLNMGTPTTGIPPFNVKTLRATELDSGYMFVMMNAATARQKGLADGEAIKLSANGKTIPARLRVFNGVMNGVVAACIGYGHTALDAFSQNKGANVMELLSASVEPVTGLTVWNRTAVDVSKA